MNKTKYILKSLWYYRKQHLAVLLGTIVSTAVLTGALIVGDSVKNSLHNIVDLRLGKVEYAMDAGDRFVRSDLAREIGNDLKSIVEPVLQVEGIAINPETNTRINQIKVFGVDSTFNELAKSKFYNLAENEVAVSSNLANRMNLNIGDLLLLRLKKASVIPANAPFVSDEDQSIALRLSVKHILDNNNLGRFSLKSNQVAPFNLFVSRKFLNNELELSDLANLLLLAAENSENITSEIIHKSLYQNWKIEDAGLKLKPIDENSLLELTSERVFIDSQITEVIDQNSVESNHILSYFVNSISLNEKETPYSFITSTSSKQYQSIKEDEIIINSWLSEDLKAQIGDSIKIKYYRIGALRRLIEETKSFRVSAILPIDNQEFNESLMPSFPGLTDAGSCNEWEAGVPVDFSKIRPKDEDYWKKYKGTPKGIINQKTALQIWGNKYGNYTALRFDNAKNQNVDLQNRIQKLVHPGLLNLKFQSVRSEGNRAAGNMVDFGGLFLSLSFFIIAAAILLTVLIYSLNIDSRNKETGILLGLGFTQKNILSLRYYESLITVILGSFLGVFGGIIYNKFLISALNSVWQDVVRTNMLSAHIEQNTLVIGFIVGVLIAILCIQVVTRIKLKQSAIYLIKDISEIKKRAGIKNYVLAIGIFIMLLSIAIVVYAFVFSVNQNAELLLSAGAFLLVAISLFVSVYLSRIAIKNSDNTLLLRTMAIKNASRNKNRSLSIIILLALGTFSVVITGANRKTFYNSENSHQSGTGGYEYWVESTLPVLYDLNTVEGKEKAGYWEGDLSEEISFVQFRVLEGDDASCLNLNQVSKPEILGFDTKKFEERKAFNFAKLLPSVNKENPWNALNKDFGKDVIPAYADQTVIVWGLKKSVGDTLIYQNENGKDIKLLLIGGLANSIFQGNILIADSLFQTNFPSVSGSKVILADCSAQDSLFMPKFEDNLQDLGVRGTKTSERMSAFYSVENTYLSMFMVLGGLGVIIGTIGLGIVLLRNILERKKELAVLKAIGYTRKSIFQLLFIENLFLLLVGLSTGLVSAFIGVIPSLFSNAFQMPYMFVVSLIIAILFSGLIWIIIPLKVLNKQNIIEDLKNE